MAEHCSEEPIQEAIPSINLPKQEAISSGNPYQQAIYLVKPFFKKQRQAAIPSALPPSSHRQGRSSGHPNPRDSSVKVYSTNPPTLLKTNKMTTNKGRMTMAHFRLKTI
jgi:hypothetical protein